MKSYFYLLSGRIQPVFLVDENGDPAAFDTAEEAESAALTNAMCMGHRLRHH